MTTLGDLLDCFDLELIRVPLSAHTDLLGCRKLWLEDVYERLAGPLLGYRKLWLEDVYERLAGPPDEAKRAIEGLTMEVEGTVTKDRNGHAIGCMASTRGATVDHLYEEDWLQCVLLAKLTHITVSSPSAGVLVQWGASGRVEHTKGVKKARAVAATG